MPTTIDIHFEQRELSIEEVAARSGLSAERVLSIVQGRWLPNPQQRQAIAAAVGVAIADVNWGHTMTPRNVRYHRFGLKEDL